MTQEHLAARTRLTREYVSLLELDKRTPTIFVFVRLARAVGKSPAELLTQIEAANPSEVALAKHVEKPKRTRQRVTRDR